MAVHCEALLIGVPNMLSATSYWSIWLFLTRKNLVKLKSRHLYCTVQPKTVLIGKDKFPKDGVDYSKLLYSSVQLFCKATSVLTESQNGFSDWRSWRYLLSLAPNGGLKWIFLQAAANCSKRSISWSVRCCCRLHFTPACCINLQNFWDSEIW